MSFRDTIDELERQLEENKCFYLRSFGWEVTYDTPGSVSMWKREFESGVILAGMGGALQMTMNALDPVELPDEDSAE